MVPRKFCAVLVGPLTTSIVSHNLNILKVYRIVLVIGDAFTDTICLDSLELSCHVLCGVAYEQVAKFDARAVLDADRVNVSEIEEEVALN